MLSPNIYPPLASLFPANLAIYDMGRFKADLAVEFHKDHKNIFIFYMNFIANVHALFDIGQYAVNSPGLRQYS